MVIALRKSSLEIFRRVPRGRCPSGSRFSQRLRFSTYCRHPAPLLHLGDPKFNRTSSLLHAEGTDAVEAYESYALPQCLTTPGNAADASCRMSSVR